MNAATTAVQMVIRLTGLVLIILGAAFWSGHALTLIPIHKQLGYLFVLALWALAGMGARAGVNPGLVVLVFLWGFFVAYLAAHTIPPHTHYRAVFRIVGSAAFLGYGLGTISNAIWKGQTWSFTVKEVLDGLVYALLTAGTFGWLWPR